MTAEVSGSEDEPYLVDIDFDEDGEVEAWNCDCPYDWGPVCKHTVAALLAVRETGMEHFPPKHELQQEEACVSIAVVGRPNVGKSSLTNRLLGQERSIVADMAGTTRDAIDSDFRRNGELYRIIDTAGMRRRGKIAETTERYSVARALHAVDRSDVVLMVLDARDGVTEQDQRIAGYAHEAGKGLVVVVNKWDLLKKMTAP